MYLLCITVVLFVAGEEISWGQNHLLFNNSDFFAENNLQRETNLHNLGNSQFLTHLLYIVPVIILSFGGIFSKIQIINPITKSIIPGWKYMGYNLPLAIFYYVFIKIENKEILLANITQEYFEFMFSLGFLIFMRERWKVNKSNAN